jgi:DNA polymerase/3'-5' exonuclease PolX
MASTISNCSNHRNQNIYEALLGKLSSYSPDKIYQIKAYTNAAEAVLTYNDDISMEYCTKGDFLPNVSGVGRKIRDFIWEFYYDPQPIQYVMRMQCFIPENQPIYDALLVKAATYSPDKTFKIQAYTDAAEQVANLKYNIIIDYQTGRRSYIPGIGKGIKRFIIDFIHTMH